LTDVETLRTDPLEAAVNPRVLVSRDSETPSTEGPAPSRLRRFASSTPASRFRASTTAASTTGASGEPALAFALDALDEPLATRIFDAARAAGIAVERRSEGDRPRTRTRERTGEGAGERAESVYLSAAESDLRELGRRFEVGGGAPLASVGRMIASTLDRAARRRFEWKLPGDPPRVFRLGGGRTRLMGVLNRTPDSFSDGGRHARLEDAVAHGVALVEAGADVLDIGGESTAPGAEPVSAEEEADRVVELIRELARRVDVPLSVDTTKASVAASAVEAGATIVNDVSALVGDPELAPFCARTGVGVVLMHRAGPPRSMQDDPRYDDVAADIVRSLRAAVVRATEAGIDEDRIVLDPGIGFGKTLEHNLEILRSLDELRSLGRARLVGTSRKAFLGKLTGAPTEDRVAATGATVAWCAAGMATLAYMTIRARGEREAREARQARQEPSGGQLDGSRDQTEPRPTFDPSELWR